MEVEQKRQITEEQRTIKCTEPQLFSLTPSQYKWLMHMPNEEFQNFLKKALDN